MEKKGIYNSKRLNTMKRKYLMGIAMLLTALTLTSCNDFLDITPTGKVIAKTGKEYRALLTYEYKNFPEDRGLSTLRSDEMTLSKNATSTEDYDSYFDIWAWNDLKQQSTTVSFGWRRYYHAIYIANYIIEHQTNITEATSDEINQLVGEAYMMRAYCHFLLANLYAEPYTHCNPATTRGIPLSMVADVNAVLSCNSLEQVYQQVIDDINNAKKYLTVDTWDEGFTYRFNKISADALLARVYLYKGDWQNALAEAKTVIEKHGTLEDLNTSKVLPNYYKSVESIVALEQVMTSGYIKIGEPNKALIDTYRTGDKRKSLYYKAITASAYSLTKYGDKGNDGYRCSFRSAEAYLIAAEAAANLAADNADATDNNLNDARTYLKDLMVKRYASAKYNTYAKELDNMQKADLLKAIYNERTAELAFEGHRWFDLRRTTRPALSKSYKEKKGDEEIVHNFELNENDSRYTLRFPTEAVEANPNIEKWNK